MRLRASYILFAAALLASPLAAQQTIEVPREHIEALPDLPVPRIEPDMSSPEAMVRSMEEIARIDWTGTLPEAVTEMILGASPIEAHAAIVWEMQVSGSWNEILAGEGTLNVTDQTVLGAAQGRQFYAVLDTVARDWPLHLFSFVPGSAPAVAWTRFSGPGDGHAGGGTGLSQLANHMFEFDRVLGHATPQGMGARGFSQARDADFAGDYLYTEVQGGRIRVDSSDNAYRISFSATVKEFHSENRAPTGRLANLRGWICEAAAHAVDPDSCRYDALEVIAATPSHERENVNYHDPGLSLTFNDPVEPVSLNTGFALLTREASGGRAPVQGAWMQTGSQDYTFVPDQPLRSGTIYEARLSGGGEGVRALDSGEGLETDHWWRFSTMLNLDDQAPAGAPALDMAVFQVVREAPLVIGKPSLTRVYVNWTLHDDIHVAWQPESYPMEMILSPTHPRVRGQGGQPPGPEGELRIFRSSQFNDADRRQARNTVNFFGWEPEWDGFQSELSISA